MKSQFLTFFLIISDIQSQQINSEYFEFLLNQKINQNDPTTLIKSLFAKNKLVCLNNCFGYVGCEFAEYINQTCNLFSYNARFFLIPDQSNMIFSRRKLKDLMLTGFWTVTEKSLKDVVNSASVSEQTNSFLVSDRFGNSESAFQVKNGFVRVANNTYFSGEFTVTAWVKLNAYLVYQRLIDFGNGDGSDNILMVLSGATNNICFHIYKGSSLYSFDSSKVLFLDIWHHVAFTYSGNIMKIYVNGSLVSDKSLMASNIVRSVLRQKNYIGKSNWNSDPKANFDFSDLKIYNKELSNLDIDKEYKSGFL
ncbi:unnamed protein product [Brachionus calyciflorus]|uniref:LamG-like jellyroll fold domain-containing protein n=1 Tax=Brachionus calyciflorus TaxID=104777 RepID=A0A814PG20_9BILA|nr:unnamed protein product [Brachionus calyciflorus]